MIRRLRIKFICITMVIVTVMMSVLLVGQINSTRESLIQRNTKALEDAILEFEKEPPPPADKPENGGSVEEKPKPDSSDFKKPEREHPSFVLAMQPDGTLAAEGAGYYNLDDEAVLLDIYQQVSERTRPSGVLWEYEL